MGKSIYLKSAPLYIDASKPIIFWDTCAILDILRLPYRTENDESLLKYESIIDKIVKGEIISVTSAIAQREFSQHNLSIISELEGKQNTIIKDALKYAKHMNNNMERRTIETSIVNLNAGKRLKKLTNLLWNKTIVLREQVQYQEFAHFRLTNKMSPAKVKGEYKDCYIWGTFLYLVKKINPANICCFFTPNVKDYFIREPYKLQDEIEVDLQGKNAILIENVAKLWGHLSRVIHF